MANTVQGFLLIAACVVCHAHARRILTDADDGNEKRGIGAFIANPFLSLTLDLTPCRVVVLRERVAYTVPVFAAARASRLGFIIAGPRWADTQASQQGAGQNRKSSHAFVQAAPSPAITQNIGQGLVGTPTGTEARALRRGFANSPSSTNTAASGGGGTDYQQPKVASPEQHISTGTNTQASRQHWSSPQPIASPTSHWANAPASNNANTLACDHGVASPASHWANAPASNNANTLACDHGFASPASHWANAPASRGGGANLLTFPQESAGSVPHQVGPKWANAQGTRQGSASSNVRQKLADHAANPPAQDVQQRVQGQVPIGAEARTLRRGFASGSISTNAQAAPAVQVGPKWANAQASRQGSSDPEIQHANTQAFQLDHASPNPTMGLQEAFRKFANSDFDGRTEAEIMEAFLQEAASLGGNSASNEEYAFGAVLLATSPSSPLTPSRSAGMRQRIAGVLMLPKWALDHATDSTESTSPEHGKNTHDFGQWITNSKPDVAKVQTSRRHWSMPQSNGANAEASRREPASQLSSKGKEAASPASHWSRAKAPRQSISRAEPNAAQQGSPSSVPSQVGPKWANKQDSRQGLVKSKFGHVDLAANAVASQERSPSSDPMLQAFRQGLVGQVGETASKQGQDVAPRARSSVPTGVEARALRRGFASGHSSQNAETSRQELASPDLKQAHANPVITNPNTRTVRLDPASPNASMKTKEDFPGANNTNTQAVRNHANAEADVETPRTSLAVMSENIQGSPEELNREAPNRTDSLASLQRVTSSLPISINSQVLHQESTSAELISQEGFTSVVPIGESARALRRGFASPDLYKAHTQARQEGTAGRVASRTAFR